MTLSINLNMARFDARTPWFGAGRTTIALGQLTVLIFTPVQGLMVPILGRADAPYCDGIKSASLLCWGPSHDSAIMWRWVLIVILIVVASGVTPRWTVLPHAWAAFSIGQSIALPDGGESVAQVLTLLLIPVGLMDGRSWHWTWTSQPQGPISRAVTFSASMFVRIQMAAIYLDSGLSKLGTAAWVDGSAEYYISRSKIFGVSGPLQPAVLWITSIPAGTAIMTWGTIIIECTLGLLVLGTVRARWAALILGSFLHAAIIMTIGLWSFGLIMIGGLIVVANTDAIRSRHLVSSFAHSVGLHPTRLLVTSRDRSRKREAETHRRHQSTLRLTRLRQRTTGEG